MAKRRRFKISFTFKGEPLTKSNNAKWWKGRMRIPARIKKYEQALHDYAKKVMQRSKRRITKKLVKVKVIYYLGSKRRKDLQNLPKTTMDALNGAVYKDDSQVHDLHIIKKLDRKNPRIRITIEEMSDAKWEST